MDSYRFIGPALRRLEPETAHRLTLAALKCGVAGGFRRGEFPALKTRVLGLDFANPVGLAAGFDKNAEVFEPMLSLGLGFVEVGTVTPRPQAGNPRPRIFRLPKDEAMINRLGFNNGGLNAAAARLRAGRRRSGIVGANVGANRDSEDPIADYAAGVTALAGLADYLVVNVSSPNTPGLRDLQARDSLTRLLDAVLNARAAAVDGGSTPVLLKVAPDLDDAGLEDIARVAVESGIDGLIATNTTIGRLAGLRSPHRDEAGGLSGRPLMEPSTRALVVLARCLEDRLPLIGVGGIASGVDAYTKIRAGASLVQLYTALVYQGPGLIRAICRDLSRLLRRDGFSSISEAVGADLQ